MGGRESFNIMKYIDWGLKSKLYEWQYFNIKFSKTEKNEAGFHRPTLQFVVA